LGSGDPCQLRRCDAGRVAASSSVAGIRAGGGGGQSHAHSAQRTSRGSSGQDPAHVAAGEATRWRRPAGGGEARCVAALPAPHPARPPPTARAAAAAGPPRQRLGAQPVAARRSPPARGGQLGGARPLFSMRAFSACGCGGGSPSATAHGTGQNAGRPRRSGMRAVGSDGGFVRFVWRTPALCRRQGLATTSHCTWPPADLLLRLAFTLPPSLMT
jgi:hypothetical protein